MDRHGVFDVARIPSREHNDQRRGGALNGVEHQPIARTQAILRQSQAAELIVLVGIGAGQVEHAFRTMRDHLRQRACERLEIGCVVRAVGEPDVQ